MKKSIVAKTSSAAKNPKTWPILKLVFFMVTRSSYQNRAYMNGLRLELWLKIIRTAARTNIIIIGVSHHIFLTLRNCQNSPNKDLFFDMMFDE
jgi:hypothetical protein